MNTNPYERISKNIFDFNESLKTDPDVIFITMSFYAKLRHSNPTFYLKYMPQEKTLFGMEFFILRNSELEGLDFQCFKSSHLNYLIDRFNNNTHYQDYELHICIPNSNSWESGNVTIESHASPRLDSVSIVVPNAVLKRWANQ